MLLIYDVGIRFHSVLWFVRLVTNHSQPELTPVIITLAIAISIKVPVLIVSSIKPS
jgi:hypothetical protein